MPVSLQYTTDPGSGLTYALPPGWQQRDEELIAPFTSAISDGEGSLVGSGRWDHLLAEPPSKDELIAGAAWLASEYGEFFLPFDGDRVDITMETTSVAGRPAARAGYRLVFHPEDGEPAYVRVLVVSLRPDLVSFLLGVAPQSHADVIDSVLSSVVPL